jgi:UPF0755 protein
LSRSERSRQGGERTAAERERDRQEREARRAQREGLAPPQPAPDASPSEPEPALADPSLPSPGPSVPAPADYLPEEAQPEPYEPPAEEYEPPVEQPAALTEEPAQVLEDPVAPAPESISAGAEHPADEEDPAARAEPAVPEPAPLDPPALLAPAPIRVSVPLRPPPPLPPELGGPRKSSSRRRGRGSLAARLAAVLALALVVAAVIVVVHSLKHTTHTPAIVALPVVKVLIPEGKTRAQIAEIAAAGHLKGSYSDASKRSPLLDPTQFGAPHHTPNLEGFLFPATYDMNPGASVDRLVEEQLVAFRERFGAHDIARAHALHITPYQLLIVASMVEREAQVPSDRPKIAAVIYNRLREGMPLGIDATIYYAVELAKGVSTYTHELTESELHINSPYNTRIHTGLPPTPISNPGEESIEAAAHPARAAYLYYVAGADGCGEQVFSNTQAEFEANVAKYQAAVQKNGGHPPTCKRK